jgi:flavin reductase (DIM6/NTAB) family NADH-FMN oxidoreductase RutF
MDSPAGAEELVGELKRVHRSYASGVTIVTTQVEGKPFGLAVNAFSSVSLDPATVLVCINVSSSTYPKFFAGGRFGISILASTQAKVAMRFATSGGDKFADIKWKLGEFGQPLVEEAAAHLELEIASMLLAGTHTVIVGKVLSAHASGLPPLLFHNGGFFDGGRLVKVDE